MVTTTITTAGNVPVVTVQSRLLILFFYGSNDTSSKNNEGSNGVMLSPNGTRIIHVLPAQPLHLLRDMPPGSGHLFRFDIGA